jgi:hypothetical protein
MTDETYNGWPNRETWALVLHINNDPSLHEWALELTELLVTAHGPTAFNRIGERIVDGFEDILAEAVEVGGSEQARWAFTVLGDVGSFWRIDWAAVGESFVEAVGE